MYSYVLSFCSAKFNLTASSRSEIHMPSLANGTDGSDLITSAAGQITNPKTNKINDRGLQVGSFQYNMIVAAGSVVAVVAFTAIVILVIYLILYKKRKVNSSLEVSRIPRQRSRNLNNIDETPSADVSTMTLPDVDLAPVECSPLEPPTLSPPSEAEPERQEDDRDCSRRLPPRKCDRVPIYIFLGPKESDPPFSKSSIKCKQNLAYPHLGPEDSSTDASLQCKPTILCKDNAAYIHLDSEDA